MCYSSSTAQCSSADWCQTAEKGLDFDRLLSPKLQNCVIKPTKKKSYYPRRFVNHYGLVLGLANSQCRWRNQYPPQLLKGRDIKDLYSQELWGRRQELTEPRMHIIRQLLRSRGRKRSLAQLLLHMVPLSQTTKVNMQLTQRLSPLGYICFVLPPEKGRDLTLQT